MPFHSGSDNGGGGGDGTTSSGDDDCGDLNGLYFSNDDVDDLNV